MAGEYTLAREAVMTFVASGQKQGVLRDTFLRALLNEVIAAYQEYRNNAPPEVVPTASQ